jgi:hypothetical protein
MTPVLEDTTHTLSFLGNVTDKPGFALNLHRKRVLSFKGVIGLSLCFLAGVAAAVTLIYTLF